MLPVGFATLLRNVDGVMVNDTQVLPTDIVENLSALPGVSREVALGLLDPADKQNVPKAVSLIQHLNMLKEKGTSTTARTQAPPLQSSHIHGRVLELLHEPIHRHRNELV